MQPQIQRMTGWIRPKPVIAIIGSTGTGKSQLAVHLAQRFNGEIINADALQIYSGLPIATNKPSIDEMRGVPHHLLGCIELDESPWTVTKYVAEARKLITDIHNRGKLPLVVGGTHYYVRSLLQRDSLVSRLPAEGAPLSDASWPILQTGANSMLDELRKLDSVAASWWHPNDSRRIRRSLEICLMTGRRVSEIYADQKIARETRDRDSGLLEYNALCIYLHADRGRLKSRLEDRVDDMLSRGLLHEAEFMRQKRLSLEDQGSDLDCSRGIWIAIGFKEFETYLASSAAGQSAELLQAEKNRSYERTKISTHQYAVKQARYVRHNIFPLFQELEEKGLFQVLDTSCSLNGPGVVIDAAIGLTQNFLDCRTINIDPLVGIAAELIFEETLPSVAKSNTCGVCNVTTTTTRDWGKHLNTKRHRKAARRLNNDGRDPSLNKTSEILQ